MKIKKHFKIYNLKNYKKYKTNSYAIDTKMDLMKIKRLINEKKNINVAVLGLGVGERHLNTLIKSKNVSKIKVFDLNSKKKKIYIRKVCSFIL